MPRRVSSPAFVGRSDELEVLAAALDRARAGEAAAVFIAGDSGVGKSRLAAEFERGARKVGARVLAGACVDLGDAELPYTPLVVALRALARETEPDELVRLAGPDRDELARLLPELGGAAVTPATADPLAQVRLFEAMLGVLVRLGREAPVVLAVEDLQWADPSTRAFLQFLVRNARRAPLMLVATYRSDDLHRRHPLRAFLADVERAPGVERLPLASFTRAELAAQLEAILDEVPEPRLVDELFERSEGNAFFAEELLAASRAGTVSVPEKLRDVLTLRVERLSEPTQGALRLAAVAGGSVGHALLAAASELPEEALARAVREALEHHVLVQDPSTQSYAFRHALLREALYDDLLPNERAGLHRVLARALEDDERLATSRQGAAAERAFHWSGAHEPAAALRASIEAGGEAETVSAFTEANRQFERAIELWEAVADGQRPPATTLVDLLRRAAEASFLAGNSDRAASLARRALVSIDAERETLTAALLHARLGWYLWVSGGANEAALVEYRAAAALLPPEPRPERARVLAGEAHVLMLDGDCARAAQLAREAVDIARSVGPADVECTALNTLGAASGILGDREESIETLRKAQSLATQIGSQTELLRSYVNLGEILDQAGRLDEAADVAIEGWQRLRTSIVSQAWLLLGDATHRLLRLGRWDDAERLSHEAGESPPPDYFGFAALMGLVDLETARGDLDSAERHLDTVRRMRASSAGGMWRHAEALAVAALALERGRPEQVRAIMDDLLDAGMPSRSAVMIAVPAYVVGLRAEADLAAQGRALGDEAGASDAVIRGGGLLDRIRAVAAPEQWPLGPPPVELPLHIEHGELELARAQGTAEADAWAAHAERWAALGRPFAAAYAHWREAETAMAAGLSRRATAPLQAARTTAQRLGAQPLLHEIDELARRARIGLQGPPALSETTAERLGLTARELDVLRLLAEGRTNAQIGATLYMSPKTASVHVSRIIAKLDVHTRIEAATAAHRLGLAQAPKTSHSPG